MPYEYAHVRLKELREENHLTQAQLAEKLGVSKVSVQNYENEKRTLPADVLLKLSDLFNVSTDYILGMVDSREDLYIAPAIPVCTEPGELDDPRSKCERNYIAPPDVVEEHPGVVYVEVPARWATS